MGFTIYKIWIGKDVGFNEVGSIGGLLILFLTAITWGSKEEKFGILQEEELGQRIIEKSSKISYFLLMVFVFLAAVIDKLVLGSINIMLLLLLLILSMITLPFVEFLVAKNINKTIWKMVI
ncbi:hypothetical protein [Gottfriedia solisilvae]|uniref:Uncharacterized protein n=1 Tax=Gottfriedia solisilvae TaxID=1516104 RepID=A0A8J3F465_9BACI|nr:hypothetical protein [Gottfriedia solisilvae]GGI16401.1 hypothetical protein GCM10007380_32780 [Gottfriedia solisilvae]